MLFAQLCVRIGIILTCGKHMHVHFISLRGEVWSHKTSLTQQMFIEASVLSQESEQSYLCVWGINFASSYEFFIGFLNCSVSVVFFVFLLDFGTVPTVWYFLLFI